MKKTSVTFFIVIINLLLISSCEKKIEQEKGIEARSITVSGKILNSEGKKVLLTYAGFKEEGELDKTGSFKMSFSAKEASKYIFNHGNEYAILFIEPGDSIDIQFDINKFQKTYKLTGHGFEEGQYLFEKQTILDDFQLNSEKFEELNQKNFISKIDTYQESFFNNLELYNKRFELNNSFYATEKASIYFQMATRKMEYANENNIKTKAFFEFLDTLPLNESSLLKSGEFIGFLDLYVNHKTQEQLDKEIDPKVFVLKKFQTIPLLFSNKKIVDFALYQAMNDFVYDYKSNTPQEVRDAFLIACQSETYRNRIQKELNKVPLAKNGEIAPLFTLPSRQGDTINLSDFKGKYLFIDFWATWCTPCLKEMPVIERWKEEVKKNKDRIAFVTISLDVNKEKWENMIDKRKMDGVQLIAEKGFDAKISKDYNITSLPRFILIDPEGRIANVNYPKPSSKEGEELFVKLSTDF